jgi:hypothetical protein
MIRAILAVALIPLSGCDLVEKAPAPSAHAVIVTPLPVEAAIKQDHGVAKRGPPPAAATSSDPAAAVLDAIGQAKDTVERRSYILDDRANREMP